jgi:hypothetical protein
MITPTLRIKLSDFIDKPWEKEVLDALSSISEDTFQCHFTIYFWYDREKETIDLSRLSEFLKQREAVTDRPQKTIIRPEFFDRQLYFIWYDIIPREIHDAHHIQYSRFSWRYHDPSNGIVKGIENFKQTWEFVNRDPDKRPRRQKRNDDESSNHRK